MTDPRSGDRWHVRWVVSETDCWLWVMGTRRGLPIDHDRAAHVVAWERAHGRLPRYPQRLCVDQVCGNALCVNPAHLEAVTRSELLRRRRERGHH